MATTKSSNKTPIGLVFGVSKQTSKNTILKQLKEIVVEINKKPLKIAIEIDKENIAKQVGDFKKELNKAIGGLSGEIGGENLSTKSIENVLKEYHKLYNLELKLSKAESKNKREKDKIHTLEEESIKNQIELQKEKIKTIESSILTESKEYETIKKTQEKLAESLAYDEQDIVSDISKSKIKNKGQSLYSDFDKIINRSKEAKKLADEYNAKIEETFNKQDISKADLDDLNNKYIQTKTKIEEIGVATDTWGNKLKDIFKTKILDKIAYIALVAVGNAIRKIYTNVLQLDKAITDLQIATGKTRDETKGLLREYSALASEIGATTLEVAAAADTWLRQGYALNEVNTLIKNTMMLSKLGQIDSAEASKALTSAMKGYKVSVEDSASIVDKFTAVDMEAAVSAGDIATAMAETAASAEIAGVSMDKLIGYIATVAEVTQDGAESVGK